MMKISTNKKQKIFKESSFILTYFLIILILWETLCTFNDTDIYYMIAQGRYFINNFNINNSHIFDSQNVIQNWLYCIFLTIINDNLHGLGLIILQLIFISIAIIITLKFLGYKKNENIIYNIIILFFFFICFSYINLRPQILTYILIMLEILALEKYKKNNNNKWLFIIPFLTLIEINCHASYWIMHFIVMIPYIIPIPNFVSKSLKITRKINNNIKKDFLKPLIFIIIFMIISLFINPYGINGVLYVFKALFSNAFKIISITEQQPFYLNNIYSIIIILSIICFVLSFKKGIIKSVSVWMFIGFTFLIINVIKWTPFYVIGCLFILRDIKNYYSNKQSLKEEGKNVLNKKKILICNIFLLFGYIVIFRYCVNIKLFDIKYDYLKYNTLFGKYENTVINNEKDIINICDYLDKNTNKNIGIWNEFDIGCYLEYRGYCNIYLDARPELYTDNKKYNPFGYKKISNTKQDILSEYATIDRGRDFQNNPLSLKQYDKLIDNINAEYFVVDKKNVVLINYFRNNKTKYKYVLGKDYMLFLKL